ncbi:MAG: MFS transporter [Candidatus Hydrogenedentales bacterium]
MHAGKNHNAFAPEARYNGARTLTLLGASALTIMSGATIAPAMPGLVRSGLPGAESETVVRLVLTMPALAIALCAPFAGVAADRFGRTRLLLAGVCLYAVAGTAGLWAPSIAVLLVSRAFLGAAVATIMTCVTALVGDYFIGAARSHFLGIQSAFMGFGGVLFLLLGGYLAQLSWRAPFYVYLLSLIVLPGVFLFPMRRRDSHAADALPQVQISPPLARLARVYAGAFMGMALFYIVPVQMPFYVERVLHERSGISGVVIAASTLFASLTSLQYRRIQGNAAFGVVAACGFALLSMGLITVTIVENLFAAIGGMAVLGAGMGLLMPNFAAWVLALTPEHTRGRAASGLTASVFAGQFLSPLLFAPVHAAWNLNAVFWTGAAMALGCGALTAMWSRRTARI